MTHEERARKWIRNSLCDRNYDLWQATLVAEFAEVDEPLKACIADRIELRARIAQLEEALAIGLLAAAGPDRAGVMMREFIKLAGAAMAAKVKK